MKLKINKKKLETFIIIGFIALIVVISMLFIYRGEKNAQTEVYNTLEKYAKDNVDGLDTYFNEIFDKLNLTGKNYTDYIGEFNNNPDYRKSYLTTECQKNQYIAMLVAKNDELYNGSFVSNRGEEFKAILKKEYVNKPLFDKFNRQVTNSVYVDELNGYVNFVMQKYKNGNTQEEYVVCCVLPSSAIRLKLNSKFYDGSGYSYVYNVNGPIAVYDDNIIDFKTKIDMTKEEHSGLLRIYDKDNKEYYGVYETTKKDGQWVILTVISEEAVEARVDSAKESTTKISLITILAILVFMLCFLIYKENISKKILKAAFTDEVTGYSNKQKFKIDIEEALRNNRLEKYAIAVLDIDNFKTFNGIFGFNEGDKVLKFVGDTINNNLSDEEYFCRSNSDNFYMLLKYSSKKQIKDRLANIMNIISSYKIPDNQNYKIISYCGVYKINPKNFEKGANFLIDRARLALMRIVKNHRNGYAFYNDIFRNNIVFETELENDMEQALADGDFKIFVQPKYNIENGQIAGGEALIRWQHKKKGFLTPDKFIELFERNCFITKLDYFVLTTICNKQKNWLDLGYNVVPISINQSRVNLFKKNYIESIIDAVEKSQVPPELIELEITEDVAFHNTSEIVDIINELHKKGIKFSMDDFGSGFSSLNMLKNLDIDVIKLDKAFFDNSSENKKGQIIIRSAIDMADKLDIRSVAEGVETQKHVDFLKTTGCNIAQGYFYSKPIPIDEFEELIKRNSGEVE